MLDLAVLGLLREEPRHGYDLKQQLAELGFRRVSFGSLYPALRRLERRESIEAIKSTGRRKAYRITESGMRELSQMLANDGESAEEDRSFQIRLAFFRYVQPTERVRILERRRAGLIEQLPPARRALRKAAGKAREAVDRYTLALMERTVMSTEAEIAWLDELIAAERGDQARAAL